MVKKLTEAETEDFMVKAIVDVLYPALIPFEPQDCKIQAENHKIIEDIARQVWWSFVAACQKKDKETWSE